MFNVLDNQPPVAVPFTSRGARLKVPGGPAIVDIRRVGPFWFWNQGSWQNYLAQHPRWLSLVPLPPLTSEQRSKAHSLHFCVKRPQIRR